jgi:hypothetical protein
LPVLPGFSLYRFAAAGKSARTFGEQEARGIGGVVVICVGADLLSIPMHHRLGELPEDRVRDHAMFNLAIDNKLRGCVRYLGIEVDNRADGYPSIFDRMVPTAVIASTFIRRCQDRGRTPGATS